MLRKIRIILAAIMFIGITLLFIDFTGTAKICFGWTAHLQLFPAILAVNIVTIAIVVVMTFIFGRVYCSIICPLGIMQDIISWLSKKRHNYSHPFNYSPEKKCLRLVILALFLISILICANAFVSLLEPYSAFGRIIHTLVSPIYIIANNGAATIAEHADSYMFYKVEMPIFVVSTFIVALITFVIIAILAWRNGRTYCNTICPVGTFLSFLSRFSLLKLVIDTNKCVNCHKCEHSCKAACIDSKNHKIDYSRCISCFDCISICNKQNAISYKFKKSDVKSIHEDIEKPTQFSENDIKINNSRRNFIIAIGSLISLTTVRAQKKTDGGLAEIENKEVSKRKVRITPPGSLSAEHMSKHCTSCQLCVSKCPNNVLRPSTDLLTFMQLEMSYEKGACRPECTRCSEVCPTNAITKITKEEKSSIQIGHAVWVKKNCVVITDEVSCGNCAKHCPVGAINMVPVPINKLKHSDVYHTQNDDTSQAPPIPLMIPVVNREMCIGCGTCENLCPARPFSAIYVEGHEKHKEI